VAFSAGGDGGRKSLSFLRARRLEGGHAVVDF
jgi:hypothetical protein